MKTKFTVKLILTVKHCLHGSRSKEWERGKNQFALSRTRSVQQPPNGRLLVGLILREFTIGRVFVSTVLTRFNPAPRPQSEECNVYSNIIGKNLGTT